MTKTTTIILAFSLLGFTQINGQNVGIGTATPLGKTHVVQTAPTDGILLDHSGAAGNSIEINQTNAANSSSAFWVKNSGTSRALLLYLTQPAMLMLCKHTMQA